MRTPRVSHRSESRSYCYARGKITRLPTKVVVAVVRPKFGSVLVDERLGRHTFEGVRVPEPVRQGVIVPVFPTHGAVSFHVSSEEFLFAHQGVITEKLCFFRGAPHVFCELGERLVAV